MVHKNIFFILILSFLLSACFSTHTQSPEIDNKLSNLTDNNVPEIALQEMFFEEQSFYQAIANSQDIKFSEKIRAVIVPHHLLASSFISDTLQKASRPGIDKVIIIGPNHENVGSQAIATAVVNWQTDLGLLRSDPNLVNQFMFDLGIENDDNVFINEHSIGAQATFVRYFFPKANVMGIVLSSYAARKEVDQLSQWLAQNIDESTLVIFSIDFSHYLDKTSADEMDLITKELIEERDVDKILQLTNDNVDSPASLATALLLADKLDLSVNILQNSNSFDFLNIKIDETTSYFAVSFLAY